MAAVRLLLVLSLLTLSISKLSFSLTENQALLKLKASLIHAGALDDWVSGSSPCVKQWAGVVCFGGIITGLHLSDLGLSGQIDIEALQQLRALRTISFVNNSFSGPIPEFNKLGALKALLLSHNKFSGQIANDFFSSMASLKKVWLSDNQFTGNIPQSLMQLPRLIELHLEGNQFSGAIPSLKNPKMVTSLDLSDNKLQGEIPISFSIFGAQSFAKNDGLCGKPLDKDCNTMQTPPQQSLNEPDEDEENPNSSDGNVRLTIGLGALAVMAILVLCTICNARRKHMDDDFSILEKENLSDVVPPHRHGSSKRPMESSRKGGDSSRRGSLHGRSNTSELIMVNDEKGTFGLPDLMKAAAEVLGNGGLGSAYKAMMGNGLSVVVKRMRELNRLGKDGFDAEMRRFGRIRHRNILTPLAYHFRKEEKLLVSEYMPKGSLLYVLHGMRLTRFFLHFI